MRSTEAGSDVLLDGSNSPDGRDVADGSDAGASGSTPPSCRRLPATCGPQGREDCCSSPLVAGGSFFRNYDGVSPGYSSKAYPATVSDFRLDRFEITVGRFRKFKTAWETGWRPLQGDGKHVHLNGGRGLVDVDADGGTFYEQGWDPAWTASVEATDRSLSCDDPGYRTWTASSGANETLPVNCTNWFETYAFCIWDGGFLPSAAEWNYAAAGGNEQRVYPWSSPASSTTIDCSYARFTGCAIGAVGSESPNGDARYGQADLAGNVAEWSFDWLPAFPSTPCTDCANTTPTFVPYREWRGGSFFYSAESELASASSDLSPSSHGVYNGARCGRSP